MNNNALVAALGSDAVAAVHGYRVAVVDEARARGADPATRPDLGHHRPDRHPARLRRRSGRRAHGQVLTWGPQRGWAIARAAADPSPRYLAGPLARPLDLVPTAADVLDRVTGGRRGSTVPPLQVELDDDPAAVRRLLRFASARRDRSSDALGLIA